MNLDDLKERLKSDFQKTFERLEENSTYNTIRDRFQSLNPIAQRLVLGGIGAIVLLALISVPYGYFSTSQDNMGEFSMKKELIRDLLQVQKEINETPQIPVPPPIDAIRSRVEAELQGAQLLPDQIKGVQVLPNFQSSLVKPAQSEGLVEVKLATLNLRQIVDIGSQLQNISGSVKVKDLLIDASRTSAGYFDVVYRLMVLKILPEEMPPAEEPPPKKGGRR